MLFSSFWSFINWNLEFICYLEFVFWNLILTIPVLLPYALRPEPCAEIRYFLLVLLASSNSSKTAGAGPGVSFETMTITRQETTKAGSSS